MALSAPRPARYRFRRCSNLNRLARSFSSGASVPANFSKTPGATASVVAHTWISLPASGGFWGGTGHSIVATGEFKLRSGLGHSAEFRPNGFIRRDETLPIRSPRPQLLLQKVFYPQIIQRL